jgi:hypothetical protein
LVVEEVVDGIAALAVEQEVLFTQPVCQLHPEVLIQLLLVVVEVVVYLL